MRDCKGNIGERICFACEFLKVFIDDSTAGPNNHTSWRLGLVRSFDRFIGLPVSVDLPRARFDDLELYIIVHPYRFVPFGSAQCCKIRPIYQGWRCCWFCRRMGNPAPESWLKWNARKDKKWIELWSWRCIRLLFPDVTWAALTFSGLWHHSYSIIFIYLFQCCTVRKRLEISANRDQSSRASLSTMIWIAAFTKCVCYIMIQWCTVG